MTYNHAVKIDGIWYPPNTEIKGKADTDESKQKNNEKSVAEDKGKRKKAK